MGKTPEQQKQEFDAFVGKAMTAAQIVAFSEMVGGQYILKLTPVTDKRGEVIGSKYVSVDWKNEAELLIALNWILANKDKNFEEGDEWFILGQREASHKFWESLVARGIGKPVEQIKVEANVNNYSEGLARIKDREAKTDAVGTSIAHWFVPTKE